MKQLLVMLGLSLSMQWAFAADNPYQQNYKPQNGNVHSMQANPDTQMFAGTRKSEDNIRMLEDGYDLMGAAEFESPRVKPDLALQFGKAIKADRVLVYADLASQQMPINNLQLIKEAAKTTHEVDAEVLEQKKTEENYRYYASYWAKLPMPLLGVHVIKLKPAGEDAQPLDGLKVVAVIKDSPAAKAGLQRGDVLRKLGDKEIQKPEELAVVVLQYQGKPVDMVFERDGEPQNAKVTLNKR